MPGDYLHLPMFGKELMKYMTVDYAMETQSLGFYFSDECFAFNI